MLPAVGFCKVEQLLHVSIMFRDSPYQNVSIKIVYVDLDDIELIAKYHSVKQLLKVVRFYDTVQVLQDATHQTVRHTHWNRDF